MARDDPMLRFRAAEELKSRIEERAKREHRSLNAEIVYLLEFALREIDEWERWDSAQEPVDDFHADDHLPENTGALSPNEIILIMILRECDQKTRESFMTLAKTALKIK